MRALLLAVLVVLGAVITGCGGESADEPAQLAVPWVDPDGDTPYIGSLSVNPADGTIFMGTNTGLFQIPKAGGKPAKVTGKLKTPNGEGAVSEALVAKFTDPGELIASGHPSGDSTLPPALGLIRSGDAGKTWASVSELGTSDFHAISRSEEVLVAPLYGQAQILLSRDEGKTFEPRVAPMALVDLAADPGDSNRWVATSESGIFVSEDEGKTWRQRDPTPNVRLAWNESGELFRIDPGGPVKVSTDGGETWEDRGNTGGEPQALTVDQAGALYMAAFDGTVKKSADGGRSWTDLVTPPA